MEPLSSAVAPKQGRRLLRPRGQRLSSVLRRIASDIEDRIRLSELARSFGDRTFGALLLVFALPNLIPLPPGSSTVLGVPLIFIAAQLALGRSVLWLPRSIGERSFAKADMQRLVDYTLPTLRRTERLLAPRLGWLLNDRLIGVACLVLAVVLALPIPLGNMLPALAICAFALGLMQRDGLAVLAGWGIAAASLVVVALVSGAAILAAKAAYAVILGLLGMR